MKKLLSFSLVVIIISTILSGCSLNFDKENSNLLNKVKETEKKNVITEENTSITHENASITFSTFDIEEEMEVEIKKITPPPVDFGEEITEDYELEVYDFTTPSKSEFIDLIQIEMNYDESFIEEGANEEGSVFAMYYNQSTQKWETVDYVVDTQNNKVVITTNHLSPYAVFTVKNENTRLAYIGKVNSYARIVDSSMAQEILEAAIAQPMSENEKAINLGMGIMNDWLGLSGFLLTTSNPVYSSNFLDGLGTAFNGLGIAAAVAQVAVDFQSGNDVALYGNLTKNILNIAVSNWGTSALQLSFAGVFAIDYSLNKFATTAWDGRKEIWYDAYNLHYKEKMKLTDRQWYSKFFWIWQDSLKEKNPEFLKEKINEAIENNVKAFWQDETEMGFYQEQVMKNASTGGGGLNDDLKKEITDVKRSELVARLQPVFDQLERRISYHLRDEYRKELEKVKKEFNKIINVTIEEVVPEGAKANYAGYKVKFAPLNDKADERTWTGKLNDKGQARTKFTILGHMQSGLPNTIELYDPDANIETDEPEKVVEFKIDSNDLKIKLGEFPPLDEILGSWTGSFFFERVKVPDPESFVEESSDDEEDDPLESCDGLGISMSSIMAELEGKEGSSMPAGFNIEKTGENAGYIWFGDDISEVDEQQKFYFNYNLGQIKMSKQEDGWNLAIDLRASYIDETKIKIEGPISIKAMDEQVDILLKFTGER